jgi:hypothetical protein
MGYHQAVVVQRPGSATLREMYRHLQPAAFAQVHSRRQFVERGYARLRASDLLHMQIARRIGATVKVRGLGILTKFNEGNGGLIAAVSSCISPIVTLACDCGSLAPFA